MRVQMSCDDKSVENVLLVMDFKTRFFLILSLENSVLSIENDQKNS